MRFGRWGNGCHDPAAPGAHMGLNPEMAWQEVRSHLPILHQRVVSDGSVGKDVSGVQGPPREDDSMSMTPPRSVKPVECPYCGNKVVLLKDHKKDCVIWEVIA